MDMVILSNHLILCYPLLLLPSVFPCIKVFSNESTLHIRWPMYQSFSFSTSPFDEYLGLISSRIDWLDLLAVQGTRKSLLQHHSSKASILQHSTFFMVQLSHPFMTTGKNIALTIQTKWFYILIFFNKWLATQIIQINRMVQSLEHNDNDNNNNNVFTINCYCMPALEI